MALIRASVAGTVLNLSSYQVRNYFGDACVQFADNAVVFIETEALEENHPLVRKRLEDYLRKERKLGW